MRKNTDKQSIQLNRDSFKKVFDLYFEPICEFLNYYTRDGDVIKDIVQDVFLKLWEERDTLDITYIKTYLCTAARNQMLNRLRDEQNRTLLLEKWAMQEMEKNRGRECINIDEFSEVLQQAINKLPSKQKEIFELSRQQKLTYNQIAEKKNIPVKTVETRMSMALKQIKLYLTKAYNKNESREFC